MVDKLMLEKLTIHDLRLYTDMCHAHGRVPNLQEITTRQVDMLISLRNNGVHAVYDPTGRRCWKIPGKSRQGGHLTLGTSLKFFFSEK